MGFCLRRPWFSEKMHYFSRIMSAYCYMHSDFWSKQVIADCMGAGAFGAAIAEQMKYSGIGFESLKTAGIKNYLVSAMLKGFMEIESGC